MKNVFKAMILSLVLANTAAAGILKNNMDDQELMIIDTSEGRIEVRACQDTRYSRCDYYDQNGCRYKVIHNDIAGRYCHQVSGEARVEYGRDYNPRVITTEVYRCVRDRSGRFTVLVDCGNSSSGHIYR